MASDIHNNLTVRRCIDPQSVSTNITLTGQIIDRKGYDALEFLITSGAIASGTAVFTTAIVHGDQANLSDAVAVPSDQLLGSAAAASFTFASPNSQFRLGYAGGKRYVQISITTTNNALAALLAASAVLGNPAIAPTP